MPFFIIPENERNDSTESSHVEPADGAEEESFGPTQNEPPFTFNMAVPFPAAYPLSCTYDSFHRKHTFPTPVWTRKPAISLPRRTAVDFEDFMSDFAGKLVLREPSSKKHTDEHRKNILATKDLRLPRPPLLLLLILPLFNHQPQFVLRELQICFLQFLPLHHTFVHSALPAQPPSP